MPTLTIIRGLPGSGKSTLARKIAAETGAIHIEPDMLCIQDGEYNYTPARYQKAVDNVKTVISHLAFNTKCDIIFADVLPQTAQVDSFRDLIPSDYKLVVRDLKITKEESLKRNKHNVRPEDIESMAGAWQSWRRGEPVTDCNQSTTNSSQLPKLTVEVFGRPDCPEWANYAMVNGYHLCLFMEHKPRQDDDGSYCNCGGKSKHMDNWEKFELEYFYIERPEKKTLPDRCKVGEWVWTTTYKVYFKVDKIDKLFIDGEDLDGNIYSVKLENTLPARLRPYNADEMRGLVGKVLKHSTGNYLVTAFENRWNQVQIESVWRDEDELVKLWTQLDGHLCGVLEHLENGKWVE